MHSEVRLCFVYFRHNFGWRVTQKRRRLTTCAWPIFFFLARKIKDSNGCWILISSDVLQVNVHTDTGHAQSLQSQVSARLGIHKWPSWIPFPCCLTVLWIPIGCNVDPDPSREPNKCGSLRIRILVRLLSLQKSKNSVHEKYTLCTVYPGNRL